MTDTNMSGLYDLSITEPAAAKQQIVTVDDDERFIVDLTSATKSYCSMTAQTEEEQATLYSAMNSPTGKVMEHIGEEIDLKDVYVEVVRCANTETGELQACPRIVLITATGESYHCVSKGVYGALQKLFKVYGEPKRWAHPIRMKIKLIPLGTRNILTLDIVRPKAAK